MYMYNNARRAELGMLLHINEYKQPPNGIIEASGRVYLHITTELDWETASLSHSQLVGCSTAPIGVI